MMYRLQSRRNTPENTRARATITSVGSSSAGPAGAAGLSTPAFASARRRSRAALSMATSCADRSVTRTGTIFDTNTTRSAAASVLQRAMLALVASTRALTASTADSFLPPPVGGGCSRSSCVVGRSCPSCTPDTSVNRRARCALSGLGMQRTTMRKTASDSGSQRRKMACAVARGSRGLISRGGRSTPTPRAAIFAAFSGFCWVTAASYNCHSGSSTIVANMGWLDGSSGSHRTSFLVLALNAKSSNMCF